MKTLTITPAEYAKAKENLEKIQHLPQEAQRTIMNMLTGAVAISEMYRDANSGGQNEARPGA